MSDSTRSRSGGKRRRTGHREQSFLPDLPDPDPDDLPRDEDLYDNLGHILDRAGLAALPKPEPLIEGVLDLRTTVVMPGDTGTNKTFALIGWACSIATGRPWLGHAVCLPPTPVILVVGEGAYGLDGRIAAGEEANDVAVPLDRFFTLVQPASINPKGFWTGFWPELESFAESKGARFVALDTFSSLAPDADETTDAAMLVRRMSALAGSLDGTVVLAHHVGWGEKDRSRGGSQLESDPDAVIVLRKADPDDPDTAVSLTRKKVKDGPSGATLWVRRTPVGASCVLEEIDPPPGKVGGQRRGAALGHRHLVDLVARWVAEHEPTTKQQIYEAVAAENGVGDKRVRAAFAELERERLIKSKRASVRDDQGVKTRDVWVPGDARWRPAASSEGQRTDTGRPDRTRPRSGPRSGVRKGR